MRIHASTPLYPPSSRVGAWLATHEFLRHAAELGHRVTVGLSMARPAGYVIDGVEVVRYGRELTHTMNADVVVSHLGDNGAAHDRAARYSKPSVRMVHSWDADNAERLAGAALAVFPSEWLRDATAWDGPSIVAPSPIRPADYQVTPGSKVTLINLSEEKGGALFWRLAGLLPDVEFLGVKGGYGRQIVGATDNVEVSATVDDVRDVYRSTRVLLMPSVSESWGRVGVEAMCSGIPVIAHPCGGLLESLGAGGIFVDREDVDGWAAEVRRLTDPAEWEAASTRARARADELDPQRPLEVFTDAVTTLAGVAA